MNKCNPFPDVTRVTKRERLTLHYDDLTNANGTVVSWARLAPHLTGQTLHKRSAKLLVLIELEQPNPRLDLVQRLVSYISYSTKEETMGRIFELTQTSN